MGAEDVQVAKRAIAVYNSGDMPALLDLMCEDLVATVPLGLANPGVYHGHQGFMHMLQDWEEAWEDFRLEAEEPFDAGAGVVIPVRQYGRGRGSGIETTMGLFHVAHFRDGRLSRWRLCETREEAIAHASDEPT